MRPTRSLTLRREVLADLTPGELRDVAGADTLGGTRVCPVLLTYLASVCLLCTGSCVVCP